MQIRDALREERPTSVCLLNYRKVRPAGAAAAALVCLPSPYAGQLPAQLGDGMFTSGCVKSCRCLPPVLRPLLQDKTPFWNYFRLEPIRAPCGMVEWYIGELSGACVERQGHREA